MWNKFRCISLVGPISGLISNVGFSTVAQIYPNEGDVFVPAQGQESALKES